MSKNTKTNEFAGFSGQPEIWISHTATTRLRHGSRGEMPQFRWGPQCTWLRRLRLESWLWSWPIQFGWSRRGSACSTPTTHRVRARTTRAWWTASRRSTRTRELEDCTGWVKYWKVFAFILQKFKSTILIQYFSFQGFVPGMFGVSHGALQFMTYEEMKNRYNQYRKLPIDNKLVSQIVLVLIQSILTTL